MGELKVNFIIDNLNKVKKSLENIKIGGDSSKTEGTQKGGSKWGVAGFAFLGGLLGGVISQLSSVNALLQVLTNIVNSFVAPFVPILLGLFKPVLVLLQLFLKKALTSAGLIPDENRNQVSGFEKATKLVIAAITGIGIIILGAVAGLPTLLVGALVLVVSALSLFAVDLGKALGEQIGIFSNWLATSLLNGISFIDDFFGTNFKDILFLAAEGILNIFTGLKDLLIGTITIDWDQIQRGFLTLIEGAGKVLSLGILFVWEILKRIFMSFINLLKTGFELLVSGIKSVANSFVDLFRKGLNLVIGILNKVPGVSLNKIGSSSPGNFSTNISVNIEGSADQKTVEEAITRLRGLLSRRGAI